MKTSMAVGRLRICRPMQGTRLDFWSGKILHLEGDLLNLITHLIFNSQVTLLFCLREPKNTEVRFLAQNLIAKQRFKPKPSGPKPKLLITQFFFFFSIINRFIHNGPTYIFQHNHFV